LKYPSGTVQTGGGLQMRPRDMSKIGCLFLNGGLWKGKRVVSADWVRESTTQHAPDRDYGYQWWLGQFRVHDRDVAAYGARGRGGQVTIVFPELQVVAVFTGWNEDALGEQPYDMLRRYILPAAVQQLTRGKQDAPPP
jgi:CubicO group peptidase (beta-lactamase class C family)